MKNKSMDQKRAERHKPRRITLYIDEEVKERIIKEAQAMRRTTSAHAQLIFEQHLGGDFQGETSTQ